MCLLFETHVLACAMRRSQRTAHRHTTKQMLLCRHTPWQKNAANVALQEDPHATTLGCTGLARHQDCGRDSPATTLGYNTGPETVARSLNAACRARTPARRVLAVHGALHARVTPHGLKVLLAALAERCPCCTACGGRRRRNAAASSGAGASWMCRTAAAVAFQRS